MPTEIETIILDLQGRSQIGLDFAKQAFKSKKIEDEKIKEALQYYLINWNDYTHSGLFSLACAAVGGDLHATIPTQASLSMIAAAFDLHDDIIDRSKTKNAKPTVYGKYGMEVTLLLGNAFIIEGYTLLEKSILHLSSETQEEILDTLNTSLFDVGNAHAYELSLRGKSDSTFTEYWKLIDNKAASLDADMKIGAIIGGGTEEEVRALARYGRIIGILTILREEFIDIYELEELSQKANIKFLPIPILFALKDLSVKQQIHQLISKRRLSKKDRDDLLDLTLHSDHVRKIKQTMEELIKEAHTLPNYLIENKSKSINQLNGLVESMLDGL